MSNLTKYHVSKNLFDSNSAVADKYITESGQEQAGVYPDYNFSYLMVDVLPNTVYRYKYEFVIDTVTMSVFINTHRRIIAYDSDDNYISQIIDIQPTSNYYGNATFTTPSNCAKISINFINDEKPNYDFNMMLSVGSDEPPYEPYSADIWHDLQPKIYANGVWTDSSNNPKKYSNGAWS